MSFPVSSVLILKLSPSPEAGELLRRALHRQTPVAFGHRGESRGGEGPAQGSPSRGWWEDGRRPAQGPYTCQGGVQTIEAAPGLHPQNEVGRLLSPAPLGTRTLKR